jgi:hypothetical protein
LSPLREKSGDTIKDDHAVVFAGLFWKAIGARFASDGAEKLGVGDLERDGLIWRMFCTTWCFK